ncbi:MAG: glycosyltransferase [Flavisolibacter sp.]|nr:glycosyltransferase [Flavisolibacter sp.]
MNRAGGILIDCERMKYPYTGLYTYCYFLCTNLIQTPHPQHQLHFYVPPSLKTVFGDQQVYLKQHNWHKWLLPSLKNMGVWHSTHQSSAYYPWRRKVKVLLTIHDLNYLYDASKSNRKKKKFLTQMQAKLDRADHIVGISRYTLNDVQKYLSVDSKKCSVIYNGSTINEIVPLQPPSYVPDRPFLFTMGAVVEKKNFHVLPALLRCNDWLLIIAGLFRSEQYKQRIIMEAKKYNVSDRVIFTGAVSENDKQWYLKHCLAFLFPSISEGFGAPAVEAMYFGKPVILSTHTCLPEIGGAAAYYFQNFDPDEMQRTLEESLHHYQQNDRAPLIREHALSFSYAKGAIAYHTLYDELLNQR